MKPHRDPRAVNRLKKKIDVFVLSDTEDRCRLLRDDDPSDRIVLQEVLSATRNAKKLKTNKTIKMPLNASKASTTYTVAWPKNIRRILKNTGPSKLHKALTKCECTLKCDEDCVNRELFTMCTEKSCNVLISKKEGTGEGTCLNRVAEPKSLDEVTTNHKLIELIRTGSDFGVKAKTAISKDIRIIEYVGKIVFGHDLPNPAPPYAMLLSDYQSTRGHVYVDAGKCGNLSRFINHTCDPEFANTDIRRLMYDETWRIFIVAKRDINKGEAILMHYNKSVNFVCKCPSPRCSSATG